MARRRKKSLPHSEYVKIREFPQGSIAYIFRRAGFSFGAHGGTDLAAALTYFTVLSAFPALLAILSLLGIFGQGEDSAKVILEFLQERAPQQMYSILEGPIHQLTNGQGAGFALIIGILSALWSASGYVGSFGRALNNVYGVREGRPGWFLKPYNVLITTGVIVLVVLMMLMFLLGASVLDWVAPYMPGVDIELIKVLWLNGRWVLILILAVFLIAMLYTATPNVRRLKIRWTSPGAVIALFGMGLGGLGFTVYTNNFSKYNATYGLIGGVIVMLVFLWIMNNMLVFGAHVDAEFERMRQIVAGEDIDGKLRVEPRDTRAITKYQEKLEVLSSSAQEIQDLASGQQTLPKPPEPSILERVQTAVSTNTEMLRQAVSDTRAGATEAQSSEDSGDVKEKASESSQKHTRDSTPHSDNPQNGSSKRQDSSRDTLF